MTDGDKPAVRPEGAPAPLEGRQPAPNSGKNGRGKDQKRRSRARIAAQNARLVKRIASEIGVQFFGGNALLLLQLVYKDPRQPADARLKAANMALPYETARLTAVEHSGSIGRTSHEEALDQLRQGKEQFKPPAATKH